MDVSSKGCLLAGDSVGRVHFMDPRVPGASFAAPQLHKKAKARPSCTLAAALTVSADHAASRAR